ncbi:tyrosine-type recombinase/integrase [Bhargavaea ginsengi]|uniref:tyrosine-type recombinase/integrase n=1 Tax=Bhargavaea ginsengi TaxID=426757 RepID=UPI00203A6CD1|nr:tyrosine-type recombinase/integrase [Bhargavaea ginsengi]MCM3087761.1 tyrosine-type recombinase/integrase [Bhargavaea ginsengi]
MANHNEKKGMVIDVQPLRTPQEIEDMRQALRMASLRTGKGRSKEAAELTAMRNVLLFNIGINTGLRAGDIVSLRIEDVKGRSSFVIREGKTKKPRTVHLSALMADIADYIAALEAAEGVAGGNVWLFPSRKRKAAAETAEAAPSRHISVTQAYRILTEAAELIGRDDIGTHTMRKTFGYHYYRRTHDVATLMEIFNHGDQATTKRYIGIRDDEIAHSLRDFRL